MGVVLIPVSESLLEPLQRLVLEAVQRHRYGNANHAPVTEDLRRFLWALAHPEDCPGFANETAPTEPATMLTSQDLADRMGCSVQYARRVAARVGTKVGGVWLIDEHELQAS